MTIVHLTASTFFGGPERQMLGLGEGLRADVRSVFLSFAEGGRCHPFIEAASRRGFEAGALEHDTPHLRAAAREIAGRLRRLRADVLCCHGYKATILGRIAARRARTPVVAVSRGWTSEGPKVRLYEALDRVNLRWMDRVVCVSEGQAAKVRRSGVPARKVVVIPNAICPDRFGGPDPGRRAELERLFPDPVRRVVGAAGRLSPEKGFDLLIEAAAIVLAADAGAGFLLFGDGPLRARLAARVSDRGLGGRFVLAGFHPALDRVMPQLDLLVQSSHTEGMPNVVLEACAAGVPVVATAVGGTPEIIEDGTSGLLVRPGDPAALAGRILEALSDGRRRQAMGAEGRRRVSRAFSFAGQAARYRQLFTEVANAGRSGTAPVSVPSTAGAAER